MAFRIKPSDEMNSVYIRSAPLSLQTARNGGSLTSSMGARSRGNSGSDIFPMFGMMYQMTATITRSHSYSALYIVAILYIAAFKQHHSVEFIHFPNGKFTH